MFSGLINAVKGKGFGNTQRPAQRRYTRRECDVCVVEIGEITYPVHDWSLGGVLLMGDNRRFAIGEDVDFTLQYRLQDKVVDLSHTGSVVRKSLNKIAIEFAPLTAALRQSFQMIADDNVANDTV